MMVSRTRERAVTRALVPLACGILAAWACSSETTTAVEDTIALAEAHVEAADGEQEVAPPPLDEPVDVLALARLGVSGTRSLDGLPWPREQRDGAGAVRDGRRDTGWKIPAGELAWLEIDLAPAFGGPVDLEELSLTLEGGEASLEVELFEGCGAEVLEALPAFTAPAPDYHARLVRMFATSRASAPVVGQAWIPACAGATSGRNQRSRSYLAVRSTSARCSCSRSESASSPRR